MSLFIRDDDSSDSEPHSKRQRTGSLSSESLDYLDHLFHLDHLTAPQLEELPHGDYGDYNYNDYEDYDLSDSDLEWEDVVPNSPQPPGPDSFNITIGPPQPSEQSQKNAERLKKIIETKKKKVSLHNLSLLSYIFHGYLRNKLLTNPKVLKTLKKLLPESILSRVKTLRKAINKKSPDADVQLIYILKYLIKWFRLNFKITCNGLRVLGYVPEKSFNRNYKGFDDYFIQNSPHVTDVNDLIKIIKRFNHNRDMAAQLFTGLLRSLGFNCRLVFSLPVLSSKDKVLQPKLDKPKLTRNKDYDLLYPYFWTELINPINENELIILETCVFHDEHKRITRLNRTESSLNNFCPNYYPVSDQFNQMTMNYVVSYDSANHILDVSSRYMKNICYRWFNRLDLRTESGRSYLLYLSLIRILNRSKVCYLDELEALSYIGLNNYDIPQSKASIKRNPNFVTSSTLRYDEVIDKHHTNPISTVIIDGRRTPIFFKNTIIVGKPEQQWKFLGRSIIPDQIDNHIKTTNSLASRSLNRKRIYNLFDDSKPIPVKLYSFTQTCPYIKPKITYDIHGNPMIPRNKYGNIEIFKPWMVPDGCCWLKMTNIDTILNSRENRINHNIQFVPVVTGFRFKKYGYAIPIKTGVIVLNEQIQLAKKFWLQAKIKQQKFEQQQRKVLVLRGWNHLLKRLRIKARIEKQ